MKDTAYSDLIKLYRERVPEAERLRPLTDDDVARAAGGVGGANEATCPVCGKPMPKTGQECGDGFWYCQSCDVRQLLSDAETIQMIRYMESINYPDITYPVWWSLVNKPGR